jgi:RHS repeat-associated protein
LSINESGLEVERTEYYPYGAIESGGSEKYGFTGQENDADTGLMYYGARYYSPEFRVFVQPDSIIADPYNPQALNRYAYALNNPVKYTDPSGHYIETGLDLAFIVMDLNDIRQNPSDMWAWGALGADVACAALPIATGGGLAVRGLKAANKIDNAVDTTKVIDKSVELEKGIDVVDTVTDGKKYLEDGTIIQNGHLAGTTHSNTGVLFDEAGFPIFDSVFDSKIDDSLFLASDYKQFKQATLDLSEAIKKDPSLGNQFTESQLQEIARGRPPSGYTWHHNQEEGILQLVESNIHKRQDTPVVERFGEEVMIIGNSGGINIDK